ncbi:MAG: PAS domain S-box protein [Verrucomicrobia bacterium]|nr:PAS domain S-box protein [Verrucomicrobiota bacterium]
MNNRIRLLLLEDRPSDAELILHELRRAGYEPEWTRVETEPDYLAQLDQGWGIILADYNLPQFTGLRALELLNERALDIPFIIVSGTIGEERAVQAMKDGASDYVMKDRLARLAPAVERTLREAALRRESKRAAAELQATTQMLASTIQTAPDAIVALDVQGRVILWNPAAERMFGWAAAEIQGRPCPHVPPTKQEEFRGTFEGAKAGTPVVNLESQRQRKDGSLVEVSFSTAPLRDAEGCFLGAMAIFQDISERKRTESQLKCFASLGMELSAAKAPAEAARTIVKAAAELLGWDACYLDLWKPGQPYVSLLIGMDTVNGQRVEVPLSPMATQPSPMMRRVMAEGGQLILRQGSAQEQPPLVPFGDTARRSQSLLLVPVRHEGQAIGVLSVQTYRPNAYAASDLSTLQALADHCAGTLDRLQAETELEQTARQWQTTFDATNNAIWILDNDHRVLRTNKTAERFFHRSGREMLGQHCWQIVHGAAEPCPNCPFVRARQTGHREKMELQEGVRWLEVNVDPIFDAAGQYTGAVHIVSDITERKQAEAALRESHAVLSLFLKHSPIFSYIKEVTPTESRVLLASDNFQQMIGIPASEMVGKTMTDLFPAEFAAKITQDDWAVVARGEVLKVDEVLDGRNYATIKFPIILKGRALLAGYTIDITDRKRLEHDLATTAARFQTIVETEPECVKIVSSAGLLLDMNPAGLKMLDAESLAHAQSRPLLDFIAPEHQAAFQGLFQRVMQGQSAMLEFVMVGFKGRRLWLESHAVPLPDPVTGGINLLSVTRDITERKRGEVKIREQAALLDQTNDAILVRTLDGLITFWNKGAEHLLGWTSQEMLGRNVKETQFAVVAPEKRAEIERQLLVQGYWAGEIDYLTKTGHTLIGMARTTLLRDAAGAPQSFLSLITDLTEQKKLEAQFLRAQRLEAVGTLAGGVAHDLNNILAPILMGAPMLRELPMPAEMASTLDAIESSAQRGTAIVRQLLTFSRGQTGQRIPLHLKHLLRDLHHIIRETFPKNITFTTSEAPDLWPLVADPTQLHQILLNLCLNARDAMPDGGTLVLTAANFQADDQFAAMTTDARPGPYMHLQVSDTGAGIPPEHLEKIFDPFFTTKEVGKGTGLGLATVQRVVSGHGGLVRVHSQMGKGTTFHIYLPAAPEAIAPTAPVSPTARLTGHGELILVVDDECPIRRITQQTLARYGYRAVTAGDGTEAISLFAQHQTEVRAVLTDLMMPGLDGLALVKILARMAPRLPVVISTGLGRDPRQHEKLAALELLGVTIVLTKPYTADERLHALHAVLSPP